MMDGLRQDLRFAVRQLVRSPGLAVLAVAMLALGIGATTTIFSVIDAVFLRPPVHVSPTDPATLLSVVVLFTTVALLASWLPARRAAAVDPMRALRSE